MPNLNISVDAFAYLREIRKSPSPDPVCAAAMAELSGANAVSCCLRPDRRFIQERDVRLLKQTVKSRFVLEMTPGAEGIQFAVDILPHEVTLVCESHSSEASPESGLDVVVAEKEIAHIVEMLQRNNVLASLAVDPDIQQIKAVKRTGATAVMLHTGAYGNAVGEKQAEEYYRLVDAIIAAHKLGLRVRAGRCLDYTNVRTVSRIEHLEEITVGYAVFARACMMGVEQAVRDMANLIRS